MDILLDSELEPFFFDFSMSFDFLAVAAVVLTAGLLSFWRVFQSPSTKSIDYPTSHHQQNQQQQQEESSHYEEESIDELLLHPSTCETCTRVFDGEADGITKGKFTLYIEENGEGEGEDDVGRGDVEIEGFNVCGVYSVKNVCSSCMSWDWEDMFVRRDLGWYSCQDLRNLNGSVVKLWDGKIKDGSMVGW